ncbi:MAG: saccharopine dehydrogenase C-terminal domain-containing protein [Acidilobus sp.]
MARVAVIGAGGVGTVAASVIAQEGHDVVLVDKSQEVVTRSAQRAHVKYAVADALKPDDVKRAVGDVDLFVTALPGSIAFQALKGLLQLGVNIVDVSFFPQEPDELAELASKQGVTLVVDAGVAPGLSNMLVGVGDRRLNGIRAARIFVGGISERPDPPLGLVPSWSISDLIDEYRRPARIIVGGRTSALDPLIGPLGTIYVPGVGELEYFPTDGLRTLLRTYSGVEFMAEFTLRWPGHVAFIKGLKKLGLLEHRPVRVGGVEVMADDVLASLLWSMHVETRDVVVMVVEVYGGDGRGIRFTQVTRPEGDFTAMSRITGSVLGFTALTVLEGKLRGPGAIFPEQIGKNEEVAGDIMTRLAVNGMEVTSEEFTYTSLPIPVTMP